MKKLLFFSLFAMSGAVMAQTELTEPRESQGASVKQRIGLTDITIVYHAPLVKGRAIWGGLVPYNRIWRAGANENTTVTFTTDVKVEGKPIAAGTYGLHMIPTEKEWTLIFSNNAVAWGSFFYTEKDDALRVKVTPRQAPMQEWLSYVFAEPGEQSVIGELHWEKLCIPFKIEVDVVETVVKNMARELTDLNGFFWQGYNQAADYCIRNNVHLDMASAWVERSIRIQKNFSNVNTKASLLEKQGKVQEAEALRKDIMEVANEAELNAYGYALLSKGKIKEANDIFKRNVKRFPASWNVYDSQGDGLVAAGDKKAAVQSFRKALSLAPQEQKKRIEDTIAKLM